ncbi:hypothetical protein PLICRDRAFT_456030 [Plicaturopsis crispa FD-325 SS-3]|uniref:Amidase domain-containing protein n=1 Tax=Plicaturopsis crispa FD-325 SS-3 TaxID=944288 RepID=A0A0C9SPG9_PLICR|nr:hypothetical protein PLICRDRAFT_456030 [Plicaturopsis crispa FD-325 SS-3]
MKGTPRTRELVQNTRLFSKLPPQTQAPTMFSWSSAHSRDCAWKQESRKDRVDALSPVYGVPHTDLESKIHGLSLSHLVDGYAEGHFSGYDIIRAYGKRALAAHNATNCLTDLIFDDALTGWDPDTKQPLLGVPISIKDCIDVQGCDTTVGYSRNVRHPAARDAAIVRLLRDAGALVYAKTTNPTGLFGCETFSDLFGYTSNPYNAAFAAGGSTGGGAALLAYRGSKIEIGTDIGGSLRAPAHWCGVYGMKASVGRFPGEGCVSCSPGLEGIQIITSPMAHDLADLEEFWKRMMQMQPWKYDRV